MVISLNATMALCESEMVYLPLSTPLLRILFFASIVTYTVPVNIEAYGTRLLLMIWAPATEANPLNCSIEYLSLEWVTRTAQNIQAMVLLRI